MLFELNDKFVVGYSVPLPDGAEIEIFVAMAVHPLPMDVQPCIVYDIGSRSEESLPVHNLIDLSTAELPTSIFKPELVLWKFRYLVPVLPSTAFATPSPGSLGLLPTALTVLPVDKS